MQSLATFFEDNKPLAYAATVAAIIVLIAVVYILYRLLFGRRLRTAVGGRARQPRLGIVDAFDLDRQRQLVLVRRDNVEHLIMIGGPTDVVIEAAIVRTQAVPAARDKDAAALLGALPGASSANGTLPIAATPAPASSPASATRTEPSLGTPSPVPPAAERGVARPPPTIDSAAPVLETTPPAGRAPPPPGRPTPVPPRPQATATLPPVPPTPVPPPSVTGSPATPTAAAPGANVTPPSARPPLPPRPLSRPPLPPRPSLASGLPPRPIRPLPSRAEPQIVNSPAAPPSPLGPEGAPAAQRTTAPESDSAAVTTPGSRPGLDPEGRPMGSDPSPQPVKGLDTLESLEEEMAKLLGRPAPRRED